jgi:hypothetical protein
MRCAIAAHDYRQAAHAFDADDADLDLAVNVRR